MAPASILQDDVKKLSIPSWINTTLAPEKSLRGSLFGDQGFFADTSSLPLVIIIPIPRVTTAKVLKGRCEQKGRYQAPRG